MTTPLANRIARMRARLGLGKVLESGYQGAALPSYDQQAAEENDPAISREEKARDFDELRDDWHETTGTITGDPEAADDLEGTELLGPSGFDLPFRTELRARARKAIAALARAAARKDANGAAETNAGEDLDDLGDQQTTASPFARPSSAWIASRNERLGDAALCIVWSTDGRVLTVSRPEPPHELAIPGGLVDPGETPDVAAVRELREECGIDVKLQDADSAQYEMESPTDGRRVFVFVAASFEGVARAAEPNTEIAWLTPAELLAQAQLYRASARALMAAGLLTPPTEKAAVAKARRALHELLGIGPGSLIQVSKTEASMSGTKKDGNPAGPGAEPNGDETLDPMSGSGGADIVEIATERLNSIMDSISANGGTLSPEIKGEIAAAVALLETVAPDDDDDLDETDENMAPTGPGQPMPMTANEKRAGVAKLLVGRMEKMRLTPEAFLAKCFRQLRKALAATHPLRKAKMLDALRKQLTYGQEVYGNEAAFQATGSDVPEIPMYSEAFVDVHVTEENPPAEEAVRSGYAYDATYTPNANSQTQYDAGSPNFVEKFAGLRRQIAKFAPASIATPTVKAPVMCAQCGKEHAPGEHDPAAGSASANGKPPKPAAAPPAKGEPPPAKTQKGTAPNGEAETWPPEYVNELPDDAFLHVEEGAAKDAGGLSTPRAVRHWAVKDKDGNVDDAHVRRAMAEIPNSGMSDEQKKALLDKAQALLDVAKSEDVRKRLMNDDGWPDDLASPAFLNAQKIEKRPLFGFDSLADKAKTIENAQE